MIKPVATYFVLARMVFVIALDGKGLGSKEDAEEDDLDDEDEEEEEAYLYRRPASIPYSGVINSGAIN